ncbi:hypothetical protein VSVS12_04002 [Vibrio scophthalmi]|nr:hypothetical protein VSVS12_04002 [Vibrio scophthalmi]
MSELLLLVIYCALLGSGVGFLAGLLGTEGSPHNFPKAQPCLNRF